VIVRSSRRGGALIGIAISAALLFSACGGGGSSKASGSTSPDGTNAATTTEARDAGGGGSSKCFTTPGDQKAKVRFVNLFTNSTYPQGDIDVWQGYGATDGCGEKLATVKYGEASDYIDVTAADQDGNWSASAYLPGFADEDHQIINQTETWKGGEQVTIVFSQGDPESGQPPVSGSVQAFFEHDNEATTDSGAIQPVAGKAVLAIAATSLQYVVKDGAWVPGLAGQTKCLLGVGDTENTRTNIGGTSLVIYPVAPGSLDLGLFPSQPGTCTGTAAIGPVTIDGAADSRTLVLVHGTDAQNLKMLVLPVAD
jgi:hypothetical protein